MLNLRNEGKAPAAPAICYAYGDGTIRNNPLSDDLVGALSFLPELGVELEVFSGGQDPKGSGGRRTGSTRHDHGNAADVFFRRDGRRLDWRNEADIPLLQETAKLTPTEIAQDATRTRRPAGLRVTALPVSFTLRHSANRRMQDEDDSLRCGYGFLARQCQRCTRAGPRHWPA